jgi:hypothetical protein
MLPQNIPDIESKSDMSQGHRGGVDANYSPWGFTQEQIRGLHIADRDTLSLANNLPSGAVR